MASFPVLSSGSVAQYPLTDSTVYQTQVHHFEDDKEQRYRDHVALREFELVLANIPEADYALIETFFDARGGSLDATWDITINGTLVPNCSFAEDTLSRVETKPGFVTLSLRILQTKD